MLALLVPFVLGGRLASGEMTLIASAVGCTFCWGLHQLTCKEPTCRWTKAELCLALIIAVGLIQVLPLSTSFIDLLSPKIKQVLPMWNGSDKGWFERWPYLSLNVGESRQALAIGLSYVLLFWLTAQRIRNLHDVHRLLRGICVSAAIMAGFALLQFLTSNGKYYWFFDFPAGTTADRVKGAFPNKNHFGAYLTLAIGPGIWWLKDIADRPADEDVAFGTNQAAPLPKSIRVLLTSIGGSLIVVGLLSSMSRGAFVSSAVGVSVMLLIMYLRNMISKRVIGGLVALAVVAGGLQLSIGYEKMVNRLNRWDDNGRLPIWKANLETIADFPVLGTGVGSHRFIHLRYIDKPYQEQEYTHAESNYMQVASETGLVGLSVALLSLGVCCFWCYRGTKLSDDPKLVVAQLGIFASVIATCVGSLFDFMWYIPGYMVILVLQTACACRLYQIAQANVAGEVHRHSFTLARPTLAVMLVLMLMTCAWMVQTELPVLAAEPHWLQYRRLVFDTEEEQQEIEEELDDQTEDRHERELKLLSLKLQTLRAASKANPEDSRVQLRLMRHYLLAFHELQRKSENAMPLNQIRDAVIANDFQSGDEQRQWLQRAFGDSMKFADAAYRHGRRSLKTNPLLFPAYLDLAELGFLGGAKEGFQQRCIDQALQIAPNEAQVLYVAGREALLKGENDQAMDYWKRAFHRSRGVQFDILRIMSASGMQGTSSSQVELIVSLFDPDTEALDRLALIQQASQQDEECRKTVAVLAQRLEAQAESEDTLTRAKDWLKVAGAYNRLHQYDKVERCYQQALAASSSSYLVHFEFGMWLYLQRRGTDAREHLSWCNVNNPTDARVTKILDRISRGIFPELQTLPTGSSDSNQPIADGSLESNGNLNPNGLVMPNGVQQTSGATTQQPMVEFPTATNRNPLPEVPSTNKGPTGQNRSSDFGIDNLPTIPGSPLRPMQPAPTRTEPPQGFMPKRVLE